MTVAGCFTSEMKTQYKDRHHRELLLFVAVTAGENSDSPPEESREQSGPGRPSGTSPVACCCRAGHLDY